MFCPSTNGEQAWGAVHMAAACMVVLVGTVGIIFRLVSINGCINHSSPFLQAPYLVQYAAP